jgi:predicted RNA-binding protein associated with RNAse of E/G family
LPHGEPWSVWLFRRESGEFWGWYVNLEQPHRWHERGLDTRDNVLDVMVHADRSWQWKDQDELDEAVRQGFRTAEEAERIRADGRRVLELVEAWAPPFSDGWERWQPDPAWPRPELPTDWADG